MSNPESPFFVFDTHASADEAVRMLGQSGFDMTKLSLGRKGFHSEEKQRGFYTPGLRIKAWGSIGAFWGGVWGLLLSPAVFMLPGSGVVGMAGPFVATLVGALGGAVVIGGLSALGAALTQFGAPKDQINKSEAAVKFDRHLPVVHRIAEDQDWTRSVFAQAKTTFAAWNRARVRTASPDKSARRNQATLESG